MQYNFFLSERVMTKIIEGEKEFFFLLFEDLAT